MKTIKGNLKRINEKAINQYGCGIDKLPTTALIWIIEKSNKKMKTYDIIQKFLCRNNLPVITNYLPT